MENTYFISYTGKDLARAEWVDAVLRGKLNADTIMQEYDFRAGENFVVKMHEAIRKSQKVLLILTKDYLESYWCESEWANAYGKIIPVRFDDCKPDGMLKNISYIELNGLALDEVAAEKLITGIVGKKRPASKPQFTTYNLPPKNAAFAGRQTLLAEIQTAFKTNSIVTMQGAGGFGKTQTAAEYAHKHINEYDMICVFNAESEGVLQSDYRNFYEENINENDQQSDFSVIKKRIDKYFKSNAPRLLIYENAEGCPELKNYLPVNDTHNHVIINSRLKLNGIPAKTLKIAGLSPEDAVELLQKRNENISGADAQTLAEELGYLPLALACAASYIAETGRSVASYLEKYNANKLKTLDKPLDEYQKTIADVWNTTFEALEKEAAKDEDANAALQLFRLCTYCAPDNIPLNFFIKGRSELPLPLQDKIVTDEDEILLKLSRYSLVEVNRKEKDEVFLSIHRLMHEAARGNFELYLEYCLNVARLVFNYKGYEKVAHYYEFSVNMPHVAEITRHAGELLQDDASLEKIGFLYNEIGLGVRRQGEYDRALEWYNKALAISEKVLGAEHPSTATTYNNIAEVYRHQGEYDKALEWFYKALAIRKKVLGTEHPSTATTYNNIAGVYLDQGKYDKALEWYNKALAIREKVLGTEHPDMAMTYNNIAGVYHNKGEYDEALEWYYKALAIREKVLGTQHPYTATTYNNIAVVYDEQGEYDKALELYNKALAIYENVLGEKHPRTILLRKAIAICQLQLKSPL